MWKSHEGIASQSLSPRDFGEIFHIKFYLWLTFSWINYSREVSGTVLSTELDFAKTIKVLLLQVQFTIHS